MFKKYGRWSIYFSIKKNPTIFDLDGTQTRTCLLLEMVKSKNVQQNKLPIIRKHWNDYSASACNICFKHQLVDDNIEV